MGRGRWATGNCWQQTSTTQCTQSMHTNGNSRRLLWHKHSNQTHTHTLAHKALISHNIAKATKKIQIYSATDKVGKTNQKPKVDRKKTAGKLRLKWKNQQTIFQTATKQSEYNQKRGDSSGVYICMHKLLCLVNRLISKMIMGPKSRQKPWAKKQAKKRPRNGQHSNIHRPFGGLRFAVGLS